MMKNSMKRKHLVMLPLCALFFFIGAVIMQAATYYVATTGNDSNSGTVSQPFRSIANYSATDGSARQRAVLFVQAPSTSSSGALRRRVQ